MGTDVDKGEVTLHNDEMSEETNLTKLTGEIFLWIVKYSESSVQILGFMKLRPYKL